MKNAVSLSSAKMLPRSRNLFAVLIFSFSSRSSSPALQTAGPGQSEIKRQQLPLYKSSFSEKKHPENTIALL